MKYHELGSTGLKVSVVGFGGIPVQRVDASEVAGLLQDASARGINFIDSVRAYTVSEQVIGNALRETGLRDQFILATKTMARTYDAMQADIDISLANYCTDYIELYQMHNLRSDADFDTAFGENGALAALLDAKKAGKIGHIGATVHSVTSFEKVLAHPEIETVMFPYNICETQGAELIHAAAQRGIGIIGMKPLAGGSIEDGRLAVRFVLQNKDIALTIPGMASLSEICENAAAADEAQPLSETELQAIEAVRAQLTGDFCRRCGYCAPCAVGIDIPGLFILEGYLTRYDLSGWAHARYAANAVKASACIECGECEPRCPYGLPIREKMRKVAQGFGE